MVFWSFIGFIVALGLISATVIVGTLMLGWGGQLQ